MKPDGLPNVLVPGLAVVTLVNNLAHCEPVTNAVNALENIHPNILVVRSVVSELLIG